MSVASADDRLVADTGGGDISDVGEGGGEGVSSPAEGSSSGVSSPGRGSGDRLPSPVRRSTIVSTGSGWATLTCTNFDMVDSGSVSNIGGNDFLVAPAPRCRLCLAVM